MQRELLQIMCGELNVLTVAYNFTTEKGKGQFVYYRTNPLFHPYPNQRAGQVWLLFKDFEKDVTKKWDKINE